MQFYCYDILLIYCIPWISRRCLLAPTGGSDPAVDHCQWNRSSTANADAPPPHHSHPRIRRPALEIEAPGPYRPVWGASPTCDGEVSAADSFWEAICGERDREKENPLGNHQQPPDASQQQQFLEWPLVVPLAAALPSLRSEPSSPALASISGHPGAEGGALVGGEGLGFLTCSVFKNKKVKNSINPGVRQEN